MTQSEDLKLNEFLYLATTRCNYRCSHCNSNFFTGCENEMSSSDLIKCYENSDLLKTVNISVAGGEPFIKEDIEEFIFFLDKSKIPCVITTNGYFVDKIERLTSKIVNKDNFSFSVSIDGLKDTHNKIRGNKEAYDRAVASAEIISKTGIGVHINMVVQKENVSSLSLMQTTFSKKSLPIAFIPKINFNGEEFDFSDEEIRTILSHGVHPRDRKYLLSKGEFKIKNCHAGISSWLLDSNGDVYACCGAYYTDEKDNFLFGNIKKNNFDLLFRSKKKLEVYNNVKHCGGCLSPCDAEREVNSFGLSVDITKEELKPLLSQILPISHMDELSTCGGGWHSLEQYEDFNLRWMKHTQAKVYINPQSNSCNKIRIKYIDYFPKDKMNLTIKVNNIIIHKILCEKKLNIIDIQFDFELPKNKIAEVLFEIEQLWRPCDVGQSLDDRQLGLAICEVACLA